MVPMADDAAAPAEARCSAARLQAKFKQLDINGVRP
jgi:hypothetical protein